MLVLTPGKAELMNRLCCIPPIKVDHMPLVIFIITYLILAPISSSTDISTRLGYLTTKAYTFSLFFLKFSFVIFTPSSLFLSVFISTSLVFVTTIIYSVHLSQVGLFFLSFTFVYFSVSIRLVSVHSLCAPFCMPFLVWALCLVPCSPLIFS
jgi:hypothetical protein